MKATMKTRFALPLFACALLNAPHALAGADLHVKGRITPNACTLTMANGGAFDFGTYRIGHTNEGAGPRTTSLSLECAREARVAIRLIDNRADTPGYDPDNAGDFTLSTPDGQKTGAFRIGIDADSAWAGTEKIALLRRLPGEENWSLGATGEHAPVIPNAMYSFQWRQGGMPKPDALSRWRVSLSANVNLATDIDPGKALDFDGSATVELHYL